MENSGSDQDQTTNEDQIFCNKYWAVFFKNGGIRLRKKFPIGQNI